MNPMDLPLKSMTRARYVMIGGFLGAGKTTAVSKLARHLSDQKMRVGLITNDQGRGLVDTAMLRSHGFATEEIPGGCFCCRFNSLVEAAEKLSAETRPDVFIAEPVGSCTDLVATVSYPLRRIYGQEFQVAPLTVLIDPLRALRIFGLEPGHAFSPKVLYIYRKQLEEADLIVINKLDLVDAVALARLEEVLRKNFPKAWIHAISARSGAGMAEWFERIFSAEPSGGSSMEVDYEVYAEGEALLGWLNATVRIESDGDFDGNEFLRGLARRMQEAMRSGGGEVAHLKMTLEPDESLGDLAVINLVRNESAAEMSHELSEPLSAGVVLINARAEMDPVLLEACLRGALEGAGREFSVRMTLRHSEHFRPGKPTPTHRLATFS